MSAPNGNKNAVGNSGGGRPSLYKEEYAEMARKIALLGATDKELAAVFEVSEVTINNWKQEHVEFSLALKRGKFQADAEVADRLYQRALGYEHDDVHVSNYQGEVTLTPIKKYYPPDTGAAAFWLKNRQSQKWREKVVHAADPEHPLGETVARADQLRQQMRAQSVGHRTPESQPQYIEPNAGTVPGDQGNDQVEPE